MGCQWDAPNLLSSAEPGKVAQYSLTLPLVTNGHDDDETEEVLRESRRDAERRERAAQEQREQERREREAEERRRREEGNQSR